MKHHASTICKKRHETNYMTNVLLRLNKPAGISDDSQLFAAATCNTLFFAKA
jgi:hypothetical protein